MIKKPFIEHLLLNKIGILSAQGVLNLIFLANLWALRAAIFKIAAFWMIKLEASLEKSR